MAKITVSFTFDDQEYPEVASWLESLPNNGKSKAIRQVLDVHVKRQTNVTLGDVYQEVRELRRKLETGAVVLASGGTGGDVVNEPPEAAAVLDSLGL